MTNNSSPGLGFLGLLSIVFITLKLCGIIGWSWAWILAPLWAPIAFCVAFFAFAWIVVFIHKASR